jgi:hypothetical protein
VTTSAETIQYSGISPGSRRPRRRIWAYNSPADSDEDAYDVAVDDWGNISVVGSEVRPDLGQDRDVLALKFSHFPPCDFDDNAVVGLGDFSLFPGVYVTKSGGVGWDASSDLDRNRFIGLGDFSLFSGLYGTSCCYTTPPATSVPEPATLALLAAGALALLGRRCR